MLVSVVILAACTPKPEQIAPYLQQTLAAWPTQTAYPTLTPNPTFTLYPTFTPIQTYTPVNTQTPKVIVVTATGTATPEYTPTITETPTPTKDPLMMDKRPGIYVVGTDIAPGLWRSLSTGDDCYWEITTRTGDIIDNHFGKAGGTMYIQPNAFQVMLEDECGNWTYLGE